MNCSNFLVEERWPERGLEPPPPAFSGAALWGEIGGSIHTAFELSFTAVTRVQIPSGTPNLFSNLRFPLLLYIGTNI